MNIEEYKQFRNVWSKTYKTLHNNPVEQKTFLLNFAYLLNLMIWEKFSEGQKNEIFKTLSEYLKVSTKDLIKVVHSDLKKVSPSINCFDELDYMKAGCQLISDIIYSYPEPDGVHVEDWMGSQADLFTLEENTKAIELITSNQISLPSMSG